MDSCQTLRICPIARGPRAEGQGTTGVRWGGGRHARGSRRRRPVRVVRHGLHGLEVRADPPPPGPILKAWPLPHAARPISGSDLRAPCRAEAYVAASRSARRLLRIVAARPDVTLCMGFCGLWSRSRCRMSLACTGPIPGCLWGHLRGSTTRQSPLRTTLLAWVRVSNSGSCTRPCPSFQPGRSSQTPPSHPLPTPS